MRFAIVLIFFALGCASAGPASDADGADSRRTSLAYVGAGGLTSSPVIQLQAGAVLVRHSVPSGARLRATTLEGLDPENRHLTYRWERDGTFEVAVSGRYRHSVLGAVVGDGGDRLTSRITYALQPEG